MGVSAPALAQAQTVQVGALNAVTSAASSQFDRFTPQPSTNVHLDFTIWDEMLKEMVYYTGPSLRQRAHRPDPIVGTRLVFGHTSPYRLEGNRVVFEGFGEEFTTILDDYVIDLVGIGDTLNIQTLPREEQLAYWLNLHNALVIKGISDNYPVSTPSTVTDDAGRKFHDIPRVTINGMSLSLRNIRQDIVYRNWSDPLVIYGFFHGDIGSPSIQRKAYSGQTVQQTLSFSADEFANSLRGFTARGKTARISRHYEDAAPYFFKDFDVDVRAHLSSLLKPDVKEELDMTENPLKFLRYEDDIADLTKGERTGGIYNEIQSSGSFSNRPPSVLQRALREQQEKMQRIRKRGLFGNVTIEDIQTIDDSDFENPEDPNSINIGPLASEPPAPETNE
jgi:hypothetical protein